MAKKVSIGTFPGTIFEYSSISDSATVQEIIDDFFLHDYKKMNPDNPFTMSGRECRVNGQKVELNTVVPDGASILFSQQSKSSMDATETALKKVFADEPEIEVPTEESAEPQVKTVEKKKNPFTKEFCETATDAEIKKVLIEKGLERYAKNKYLQVRVPQLLGKPRSVEVQGKMIQCNVVTEDGQLMVKGEQPIFENYYPKMVALPGETEEALVERWNKQN